MTSQAEPTTINHFSHPHPLQLTNHQAQQTLASCSGCKLTATGLLYCCTTCNYFLHIKCSKMPQKITHPFHKDHAFSLLAKPLYPDGCFNCDACGKQGDGFSYHCKVCSIDLHILCSAMPLSFTHQSHNHQLNLIFSPPYPDKSFNCDICNTSGSNHWLYRCHSCEFDVHLNCKSIPAAPTKQPCQGQATFGAAPFQAPMPQAAQMQQPQMASRSAPQPQPQVFGTFGSQHPATGVPLQSFMPNMTQMNPGFQGPGMPFGPRQNNDLLAMQMLQSLANSQHSFNQHYLQALLAGGGVGGGIGGLGGGNIGGIGGGVGGLGGGPAGGLGGVQHILQALSGMSSGGGLGGLGGGGIPGLGGGQNILQSLISGGAGGGGGLDILQGLMGGGSGLDLFGGLGGLLGGFGG